MESDDDQILIIEDDTQNPDASDESASPAGERWPVLIVDDEPLVHEATRFALGDLRVLNRGLALHSVYSASEARDFLQTHGEPAVIFLDVVMETDSAGLELIGFIREQLQFSDVRIILRTGQPGYAPELEVIRHYDINDYRAKNELTHKRLITTVIAALRSYQQLVQLARNYQGLKQIIASTKHLLSSEGLKAFSRGVLEQISVFLDLESSEGLVMVSIVRHDSALIDAQLEDQTIFAATGKFADCVDQPLSALGASKYQDAITQALREEHDYFGDDCVVLRCLGHYFALLVYVDTQHAVADDKISLLRLFGQNIGLMASNLSMVDKLNQIAFYDSSTLLPNAAHLGNWLDSQPVESMADYRLVMLNIDRFTSMQEALGQASSTQLLQLYASTLLRAQNGLYEQLAQLGGDSFALIVKHDFDRAKINALLKLELEIDGLGINVSSTAIEFALNDQGMNCDQIVRAAHLFMAEAKQRSRRMLHSFDTGILQDYKANAEMLQKLVKAIGTPQLRMFFQPKWNIQQQSFSGMEALVRWQLPDGSMVPPNRFIPLAESSGLSDELFDWILHTSLTDYARLLESFPDAGRLAINLSTIQLRDPNLAQRIAQLSQRFGIDNHNLTLEITESLMLDNGPGSARAVLESLRAIGCRIAIDDFGTGYSSYAYLSELPVDQVKLDRSLVQTINNETGQRVVSSIIALCRGLQLEIVAEGIETEAEAKLISDLGTHEIQGFYFARPMPIDTLIEWLKPQPQTDTANHTPSH